MHIFSAYTHPVASVKHVHNTCTCMVLNNTCECIHTLRKNAYGLVQWCSSFFAMKAIVNLF